MIKKYDNVLEKDLIQNTIKYFEMILDKSVWSSSLGWNQYLTKISSNILTHEIQDSSIRKSIKKIIEKKIEVNFDDIELDFILSFYVWSGGSYLTWHNDEIYPYSGTIYLNEEWNTNDGGVFLFKDNKTQEVKGIEPTYNTMIVNSNTNIDPHNYHCVTCIVPGTIKKRITLQWRASVKEKSALSYQ